MDTTTSHGDDRGVTTRLTLTRSAYVAIAGMVILVAVGTTLGLVEAYALATGLALVLFGSVVRAVLWHPLTTVTSAVRPRRVSVGEPYAVTLTIGNRSRRKSPPVQVSNAVGPTTPIGPTTPMVISVPSLPAGGRVSKTFPLATTVRGTLRLGPPSHDLIDPFGMVTRTVRPTGRPAAGTTLTVWPRMWQLTLPRPQTDNAFGDMPGMTRRTQATPGEFSTLSDYNPGDDLRHVHWPSSARTGRLLVRRFDPPSPPTTWVLIELVADNVASFEVSVAMTASIVASAFAAGATPALAMVGAPRPASGERLVQHRNSGIMVPIHTRAQLEATLDALAMIVPDGTTPAVDTTPAGTGGQADRHASLRQTIAGLELHPGDRLVLVGPPGVDASELTRTLSASVYLVVVEIRPTARIASMDGMVAQQLIDTSTTTTMYPTADGTTLRRTPSHG